jgi:hypothetical protein
VNDRQRKALERAAESAQERSRRNWNRMVQSDEQLTRDANTEAEQRRSAFHIVRDPEAD